MEPGTLERGETPRVTAPAPRLALGALGLALAALVAAAISGFGYRFGWWNFPFGFTLLRWAGYLALPAAILAMAGIFLGRQRKDGRGLTFSMVGLLVALLVLLVPGRQLWIAKHVPMIHDISTDTDRPPQFAAILPLRAGAANSAAYGGPEVAALQHQAYPDIVPLLLPLTPEPAFDRVEEVVRAMGWHVVAADRAAGRIEAWSRTFWFGFTDDIVVRVEPAAGGSRIDVRSVSRVGKSDIGMNARRIRGFMKKLQTSTPGGRP